MISALGILSVARSFGDEPIQLSQLIRLGQSSVATQALERSLAQGEASPTSLADLQRAFEEEASQPVFLFGVRGERAGHHQMIQAVESGKIKASSVRGWGASGKIGKWWENVSGKLELRISHAPLIRIMTEMVEIAKLPVEQQRPKLKSYMRSIEKTDPGEAPTYLGVMVWMVEKFGESFWRHQAELRCAIVALAAERYRIAHGEWPDSPNSLVPEFLDKVHLDPYDGKPLHYRRLVDGVVIYSIGPDEEDNGGKIDRQNSAKPGNDIVFQLWDVNRRRQPWHPPAKTKDEEDK